MDDDQNLWQQYFPTYRFLRTDVVKMEFDAALRNIESEERIFLNAAQITLVIGAALASLVVGSGNKIAESFQPGIPPAYTLSVLILLTVMFSHTTLRYFADRRRAIVFAARKVIVLRRMLGLSYGSQQMVLPNWRIEGADEPFVVRMFSGWNTHVAYPFWILGAFSATVISLLSASLIALLSASGWQFLLSPHIAGGLIGFLWFFWLALSYRKALIDVHENVRQWYARVFAKLTRVALVTNFEYVLYRAKLATFEAKRQRVDLALFKDILVFIEDKNFYVHRGIDVRALIRAAAGFIGAHRRSGGSTITQQLARTLFIHDYHKTVRRKIVETFLARWIERVLDKNTLIELYLVSVRYERKVLGLLAAMRHFFGKYVNNPSRAQRFFLLERVSNVTSRILCSKVDETLRQAVDKAILSKEDARELIGIYQTLVQAGTLTPDDPASFGRLCAKWGSA